MSWWCWSVSNLAPAQGCGTIGTETTRCDALSAPGADRTRDRTRRERSTAHVLLLLRRGAREERHWFLARVVRLRSRRYPRAHWTPVDAGRTSSLVARPGSASVLARAPPPHRRTRVGSYGGAAVSGRAQKLAATFTASELAQLLVEEEGRANRSALRAEVALRTLRSIERGEWAPDGVRQVAREAISEAQR